ncbi:cysteine peptidase family C39 domain-containing protein [Methanoculleus sp. 7T]|jgi:hypothetical protein|uniref:hypothetical protein n=1 Tax=Methanoculleus sp. 7T TaxID=2937282 RepID=UPI0020BFA10D|nr:hypothetical protein [Methanoculleus sp. 7T]MCK8519619.1 hypothetical protein [Methanoculleus sp. 7T]
MMKTDSFLKTGALLAVLLAMGVVVAPVMAGEVTKQLSVPYYQQETPYYCGPAVAQMWIDFHNGYIPQDTLWNCIQNNNRELWHTDPYGLAACVSDYLNNFVAEDRRWSYFNTANIAMAMDIVDVDNPTPALIYSGDHWVLVKGVSYEDYYGSVYNVYGFWVHDPQFGANQHYLMDRWSSEFTPVDVDGSYWDGHWTHLRGYWSTDAAGTVSQDVVSLETRGAPGGGVTHPAVWSDTLVRPTLTAGVDRETYYDQMTAYYEAVAKNVTLMADEEDDIPLTEDTNLADLGMRVKQMMTEKFKLHLDEFEGAVPGEPVFVHSLDEKWYDYYLIPFERDGYITVVVEVSIKGNVADPGVSYAPEAKTQSVVRPTLEEAQAVLAEGSYDSTMPARLVWKPCEQTTSPMLPVWEFTGDGGDTVYVGYAPWKDRVEIYEELTMKKIPG